jgi:hypothetical protein
MEDESFNSALAGSLGFQGNGDACRAALWRCARPRIRRQAGLPW